VKKRLRPGITLVLAVLIVMTAAMLGTPKAFAQGKAVGKATDKAQGSRGAGEDPNIKQDKQSATNDPAKETPAPPKKGGAKTRGYLDCWVTADNYTPWWIDIYIDGTYRGQVAPWGGGTVDAGSGGTTVYGRAVFTSGAVKTWGPRQFQCSPNGDFTWRLDP
jgi:hypothetical protein